MVDILVVDDSIADSKIAGGLLQKVSEWTVQFATDGHEALKRVEDSSPPDVVLTDLQMPNMNGLELVREMNQKCPLIPVVLMTGQGSEKIAVEALRYGALSYVPKRELSSMLVDTIHRVMTIAGEQRSRKALMEQLTTLRCRFRLSNDVSVLSSLVAHLQETLRGMNILSESDVLRSGVALEEALLNAAYHGNLEVSSDLKEEDYAAFYQVVRERTEQSPYKHRSIHVDVEISETGLQYVITDEGSGFDISSLPDPVAPGYLERPSGRGLLLMRTFMDEVSYNDRGNQVTMTKQVARTTSNS